MKIAPRFPLEFPVIILPGALESSRRIRGRSENLSMSGMGLGLSGNIRLMPGTVAKVRIEVDEEGGVKRELVLTAKVIWCKDGRCGLEIESMSEDERSFYENLIHGYQTLCRGFADLQAAG